MSEARDYASIRRLLQELSEIYAEAADHDSIGQIRHAMMMGRAKQYDLEQRVYYAFTRQGRDGTRSDGG